MKEKIEQLLIGRTIKSVDHYSYDSKKKNNTTPSSNSLTTHRLKLTTK